MPIIGIDQVPRELPRPSFLGDIGYAQGKLAHDLLLAALTGQFGGGIGQVPTAPIPRRPGSLTFPSGTMTRTSPLELAQLQQMGGVPNMQSGVTPLGIPSQGGVQYTQPTRLGIRPDVAYQLQQQKLQTEQANQAYYDAVAKSLKPWNAPPQDNDFLKGLADLATQAQADNEDAVKREDAVRRIRTIRQMLQVQ